MFPPQSFPARSAASGSNLVFNLPGRPKSIRETIDEIWKAVPYCVDLMNGPYMDMDAEVCDAFRPSQPHGVEPCPPTHHLHVPNTPVKANEARE